MINRNYIAILFFSMLVLSTLAAMAQTGSKAGVPHFESVAHLFPPLYIKKGEPPEKGDPPSIIIRLLRQLADSADKHYQISFS